MAEARKRSTARKDSASSIGADRLPWLESPENVWGIPVLDLRSIVGGLTSMSEDPQVAANAVSFGSDDGLGFAEDSPVVDRTVECELRFRVDRVLADGALFLPSCMEEKWALYIHRERLLCIRSWQRRVFVTAGVRVEGNEAIIGPLQGAFGLWTEPIALSVRMLDFVIRSHGLSELLPAPLAEEPSDLQSVVMECFGIWGKRAQLAAHADLPPGRPSRFLRTQSLFHIAVARGNRTEAARQLLAGVPVDLLSVEGLSAAHWALGSKDAGMLEWLLERGCPVDVRSGEGATPLMQAVQADRLDDVSLLLDRGADPNASDARGYTALHRAAETGKTRIVQRLLERGADPGIVAQGTTARQLAEQHNHTAVLTYFPVER